jgi:hypothetical protein
MLEIKGVLQRIWVVACHGTMTANVAMNHV